MVKLGTRKRKTSKMSKITSISNSDNICYTGMHAKSSGQHTKKEFLDIMEKNYSVLCSTSKKKLSCDPCKQHKKLYAVYVKKLLAYTRKGGKSYKMPKDLENKIADKWRKCEKCSKKNTKKCSLEEFLEYSGAEPGKCSKK